MNNGNGGHCNPNPCQHNGICSNPTGPVHYTCSCKDGYSGNSCQIVPTSETSTRIVKVSTTQVSDSASTSTVLSTQTSTSTVSTTRTSTTIVLTTLTSTSTVLITQTPTSTVLTTQTPTATTSKLTSTSSIFPSSTGTANKSFQGDQTTVVVSVTIPVVAVVIFAVILGVCFIRRWKHRKRLGTTAKERAPGISISNTSYGDHQLNISKTSANGHATDVVSNEYAEIVSNGNAVNEQPDGYYTINDVPRISQTNNTNYAHVNAHKALMLDSNYSHIENNNKKISKAGDYGFSKLKRGIFQLKKSSKKKYTDSSYDNLEMKTVAHDPNKNVKDVAMTELESEYNHTQSGVPESTKKDIQNEKDEYQHLNYKPKSMKAHAHEVANENPYRCGQSQQTSELLVNLCANEPESENGIRHDYFVFEAIGESGDDSIKESDVSNFEEGISDSASGFQYEYAREAERSGTYKNEKTRDIQRACHYELSKDIDTNIDIANKRADVDDKLGTSSATEDDNQNHHYFILSKT